MCWDIFVIKVHVWDDFRYTSAHILWFWRQLLCFWVFCFLHPSPSHFLKIFHIFFYASFPNCPFIARPYMHCTSWNWWFMSKCLIIHRKLRSDLIWSKPESKHAFQSFKNNIQITNWKTRVDGLKKTFYRTCDSNYWA